MSPPRAGRLSLVLLAALGPGLGAQEPATGHARGAEAALVAESMAAREALDYDRARATASEAISLLMARPEAEQDEAWLQCLYDAGVAAYAAQDPRTANVALERTHALLSARVPDDDPLLQKVRSSYALSLRALGDVAGARELQEQVLAVRTASLSDDHPDLQKARQNLASTLKLQGEIGRARSLEEQVLKVREATLPADHPDLAAIRTNLATTIKTLGDLAAARELEQQVVDTYEATLPEDHPTLQQARGNLGVTLLSLRDEKGALALHEKVLQVFARTMPDDHPSLQWARQNLGAALRQLGDYEAARELEEHVLAVRLRTLPEDHVDVQRARWNLALTVKELGALDSARELEEQALAAFEAKLPADHPELQGARGNLAETLRRSGDLLGAVALEEQVLASLERTLLDDHPYRRVAQMNLAATLGLAAASGIGDPRAQADRSAALMGSVCQELVGEARAAILRGSSREAEERCALMRQELDVCLSHALGQEALEPRPELAETAFVLSETTRTAAIASAELLRSARGSPRYAELCAEARAAGDELAGLALAGASADAVEAARDRRESAERELAALSSELSGASRELDLAAIGAALDDGEAAVAFRRFHRWRLVRGGTEDAPSTRIEPRKSVCAFVVRRAESDDGRATPSLAIVDLGTADAIEAAAADWHEAVTGDRPRGSPLASKGGGGVAARGEALRRLVFDPLVPALGDARRVVVVPDDIVHLVPLDALPLDGGQGCVGERWRLETRISLSELLAAPRPTDATALVALGGASFNHSPLARSADVLAATDGPRPTQVAGVLRGGAWERGFAPLTHTAEEARGIGALYEELFGGERPALVVEQRKASRETLEELAPGARFLHVASHGWFAPESVESWDDPEALDPGAGRPGRMSVADRVRGLSPMVLCGLALAGANLPPDESGRLTGLVTAEEISSWDLSRCELAVLSACDTNVGLRRAGQGVASLQKALRMAGARSVITSVWRVPDEATKELMLDFYRRLWVEGKPKGQALWEAKLKLRDARDEHGAPVYTTRDWAGWVLTGDPD